VIELDIEGYIVKVEVIWLMVSFVCIVSVIGKISLEVCGVMMMLFMIWLVLLW